MSFISSVWKFIKPDTILSTLYENYKLLFGFCIMNVFFYYVLESIIPYFYPDFVKLTYAEKKYTVKNLSKSVILLLILFLTAPVVYDIIMYDVWATPLLTRYGALYASTDLTGLLIVPDLAMPTKIHHTTVIILSTLNMISDHQQNGLHRALLSLCLLSAGPYLVNTYLGFRHLDFPHIKQKIINMALYTYIGSVICNVFLQHLYVFWLVPFGTFSLIYLVLYYFILYDDIKLIKYLYYKSSFNQQLTH